MGMTLLISGVIMPAFMWLLLYFNIVDQYVEIDGELTMTKTKAEAQRYVLLRTIKSPFFYIYLTFISVIIISAVTAYNAFGLGDWYFSL